MATRDSAEKMVGLTDAKLKEATKDGELQATLVETTMVELVAGVISSLNRTAAGASNPRAADGTKKRARNRAKITLAGVTQVVKTRLREAGD